MKKNIIAILLLALTAAELAGCGGKASKETEAGQVQTEEAARETEAFEETQALEESQTEGVQTEGAQTGEAEEPQTEETELAAVMYALDDVYIRTEQDTEAEAAGIAERGSELTVTKRDGDWCQVRQGDLEGYIMTKFLTDSQEEAQSAVSAQEAAQEAAARAAEQAAQDRQSQGGQKQEVSRQNFDDCDGSGHGYTIITYSDGSTETVEY